MVSQRACGWLNVERWLYGLLPGNST